MTPRTTPIRVLLAATDEQLRTHVRAAFGPAEDVEIVAEADTDAAALALARRSRPDVVLLDGSALLHVLSTTRRLLADPGLDGVQVIVFGRAAREQDVLAAWRSGIAGLVARDIGHDDLLRAIRVAASGGAFVVPTPPRRPAGAGR